MMSCVGRADRRELDEHDGDGEPVLHELVDVGEVTQPVVDDHDHAAHAHEGLDEGRLLVGEVVVVLVDVDHVRPGAGEQPVAGVHPRDFQRGAREVELVLGPDRAPVGAALDGGRGRRVGRRRRRVLARQHRAGGRIARAVARLPTARCSAITVPGVSPWGTLRAPPGRNAPIVASAAGESAIAGAAGVAAATTGWTCSGSWAEAGDSDTGWPSRGGSPNLTDRAAGRKGGWGSRSA